MKDFIPYQEAFELNQLGFDEPCLGYYEDTCLTITFPSISENGWKWVGNSIIPAKNIKAPTYSQGFRWFRGKYQIDSWIYSNLNGLYSVSNVKRGVGLYSVSNVRRGKGLGKVSEYQTYEEAELECLKKLIDIVKNDQK
jgi:hypothetical protein